MRHWMCCLTCYRDARSIYNAQPIQGVSEIHTITSMYIEEVCSNIGPWTFRILVTANFSLVWEGKNQIQTHDRKMSVYKPLILTPSLLSWQQITRIIAQSFVLARPLISLYVLLRIVACLQKFQACNILTHPSSIVCFSPTTSGDLKLFSSCMTLCMQEVAQWGIS